MSACESTGVKNSCLGKSGKATKENMGEMVEPEKKPCKRNSLTKILESVLSNQEDSLKLIVTALLSEVVCMTEMLMDPSIFTCTIL